jgi:hypothetical protein
METISELGPESGAALLATRSAEEIARLAQEIPSDDAAALIDYLPEELSAAVLDLMRPKESGVVGRNLLRQPGDLFRRTGRQQRCARLGAKLRDGLHGEASVALGQQAERRLALFLDKLAEDLGQIGGMLLLQQVQQVSGRTNAQQSLD